MPMKNDTMGSLRFDEKTNYPVQYLNSAENSRAIVDIFLSALDAYIKMNGVDGDPDDAIRFARSIVRATLNNDPKELMVDLVGRDEFTTPRINGFHKKRGPRPKRVY